MAGLVKLSAPVCHEKDFCLQRIFLSRLRLGAGGGWLDLLMPSAVAVPWTRSQSVPRNASIPPCVVFSRLDVTAVVNRRRVLAGESLRRGEVHDASEG